MKLRTEIEPFDADYKIAPGQKILTLGSCFAASIGQKLLETKLECLINPYGTIYDPLSLIRMLQRTINNELPPTESYVQSDGVYKNLQLHSSFSGQSIQELELEIRAKTEQAHHQLKTADWLILTFGTAFSYTHLATNTGVTNCQKLPAHNFARELLTPGVIAPHFARLLLDLDRFNSNLKIILTISPVRHTKDGIVANNLSKAVLRLLSHELEKQYSNITYYPAYEIMLDDLRDYRFYKEDLIHPTEQAVTYIWEHFSSGFFSKELLQFKEKWDKIVLALNHKPFNARSTAHQQFLKKLLVGLENLPESIDVANEIAQVKDQILE